jgi:16S rRNA (guanine1207-N2)-methyltransferase
VQELSQFLLRNAVRFGSGRSTLCINPPGDLPWRNLQTGTARIHLFTQDYAGCIQLRDTGGKATFGPFPEGDIAQPENILLALPREKERLKMWLHWCAGVLPPQGKMWLAGENRAGIKSARQYLDAQFGQTALLDTARHCGLFEAGDPKPGDVFRPSDYLQRWRLSIKRPELDLCSYPGVFSHGKLDPGTRLLLETPAAATVSGRVLDFGCGAGVIGLCLKAMNPAIDLTMIDSNALALASVQTSLEANGLRAEVLASDGFSDVEDKFDLVISNPPFHSGHRVEPELSMHLLHPVRNFLNPGGQLLMVANRHLQYRRWLDRVFGGHRVLASNDQFQVLNAVQS